MRMARRMANGDHFIECPVDVWDMFYECWQRDNTHPAPMPVGHRMFSHPTEYGVRVFEVDDNVLMRAVMRELTPELMEEPCVTDAEPN